MDILISKFVRRHLLLPASFRARRDRQQLGPERVSCASCASAPLRSAIPPIARNQSTLARPPSFAPQVNFFFNANCKSNTAQTKTLLTTLVSAEPAFGKRFTTDSFGATTQLLELMARLAPQYKRIAGKDASGDGKGQGKGNTQPSASRDSKGSGKGGG